LPVEDLVDPGMNFSQIISYLYGIGYFGTDGLYPIVLTTSVEPD